MDFPVNGFAKRILWTDFETYSEKDIGLAGSYEYIQSPSFAPWLLSYGFGNGDILVHDFSVDPNMPKAIIEHIQRKEPVAGWSPFERLIFRRLGFLLEPHQYIDVMVHACAAGHPAPLKLAGKSLNCPIEKDPVGRLAILKFCKPRKDGSKPSPDDDPELWAKFVAYCHLDTELMRDIYTRLPALSSSERQLQIMDMAINDRGIPLDVGGCMILDRMASLAKDRINEMLVETTGGQIQTFGQVKKIAQYLGLDSCAEGILTAALPRLTGDKLTVAKLRLAGAKSSASKLPRMIAMAGDDDRSRGTMMFWGTKTARWAGRGWQPHNLPRDCFKPAEVDRVIVAAGGGSLPELVEEFGDPMAAISKCLRGMIKAPPGKELVIYDYSSIEARMVVWYAGQTDILAAYERGEDIYKLLASRIYGVPQEAITSDQRFVGKVLVLGSGYGLGWKGLLAGLARMGVVVEEKEAQALTDAYRAMFHRVRNWWYQLRDALWSAWDGTPVSLHRGILIERIGDSIKIELPSGNALHYHNIVKERLIAPWADKDSSAPEMINVLRPLNHPETGSRYSLTHSIMAENICSMTARDIMARGMHRLENNDYPVIMSVHDEVVMEIDQGFGDNEVIEHMLTERPPWALDLPLAVEGGRVSRYCKL